MPVGRSSAERLALQLRSRCGRELHSPVRFKDLKPGDVQFSVGLIEEGSKPGSFEFEVEQTEVQDIRHYGPRKVREVHSKIMWKALIIVDSDLSISFANISRYSPDPIPRGEIESFLSCALRGPD